MASKKPQYTIPAANTGVRKDVDPLIADQTMAIDGQNVIYFDGTIKPRPALDVAIENKVGINNWQELFGPTDAALLGLTGSALVTAMYESDDEEFILIAVVAESDRIFAYSLDKGATWQESTLGWPDPNAYVNEIIVADGYIFINGSYINPMIPDIVNHYIWRGSAATLPLGTGSWTELYSDFTNFGRTGIFVYDSTEDAVLWIFTEVTLGPGYISTIWNCVQISDATTVSPSDATIADSVDFGELGYTVNGEPLWINRSHIVFIYRLQPTPWLSPSSRAIGTGIISTLGGFDSGVFAFDSSAFQIAPLWQDNTADGGTTYNPLSIPSVELDSSKSKSPSQIINIDDSQIGFIYLAGFQNTLDTGSQFIGVLEFDDGVFGDYLDPVKVIPPPATSYHRDYASAKTAEKVVFVYGEDDSAALPAYEVSSDNGTTYLGSPENEITLAGDAYSIEVYFNDVTDTHLMSIGAYDGVDYHPYVYMMPTSSGKNKIGGVTSIFQVDLDDEDDALVVGTTSSIARLDKDNNVWTRITASQFDYIDGATGDDPEGPYTPDGVYTWDYDIPPLSVAPGDPDYVSGLTIDAVYGQNPWVFRATEASGKTFLLATNGQCYPLIYHSEMNGGFARRLGEVPANDPNYKEIIAGSWDDINGWLSTGNLAPRGRCMAVAANRVLLANNPTGSPFEVNVGGFNDPDRGWGTTNSQLVLLGDTPGSIVTMEEISALQVAIYKEDAIYHAIAQTEFLGVSAPFRFELAKAGVSGPCSPASVLRNFDGRQIYLARDGGVYMYDGVAPLDGGRNIRRMIQNDIDLNQLGKCWGMVDRQRKLVWFFYPGRNQQINKGLVISTDQGYPWPTWPVALPNGWNFTCGAEINLSSDAALGDLGEFGTYGEDTLSTFSHGQTAMITGRETGVFFSQKWEDDGDFSDSGLPIECKFSGGWMTPGGLQIHTADELYHIFSSPDPEQEIQVRLRAQKIGQNIVASPWRDLTASKPRRRTRHRVSGVQFGVDIKAKASRTFSWAGAVMTASSGGRNRG